MDELEPKSGTQSISWVGWTWQPGPPRAVHNARHERASTSPRAEQLSTDAILARQPTHVDATEKHGHHLRHEHVDGLAGPTTPRAADQAATAAGLPPTVPTIYARRPAASWHPEPRLTEKSGAVVRVAGIVAEQRQILRGRLYVKRETQHCGYGVESADG